ncbi:MAG: glycosyltransferase family 39 protein [Burkholderiales bacterium]|nr:glycosyltransferase family 39 protein [Burkholderiales bacterium]
MLTRGGWWALVALLAAVWFCNLEVRKLVRPDEGRYAEIPREMVASGDWITPRLNDFKYFYKPPLQYWATAAAYTAFGEHHWTARLWSALTGFLGVLFAAFTAARLWGGATGIAAGAICASALLYALIGHVNTLDMGVTFFTCGGLFCLLLAQSAPAGGGSARRWMLAAWAALALAVLSKGLIGAALPFATLVIYSLVTRDFAVWRRLHLVRGLALFLAITAPWFVAVSLANPEFFHFFFIHEHFERFLTKAHSRYQPPWYFVPMLLVGFLPWTLMLPGALVAAPRLDAGTGFRPRVFLLVWSGFVFAFFSASSSKLPSYILPILPPLALLVADRVCRTAPRALTWHAAPYLMLGVAMMLAAPLAVRLASDDVPRALYESYVPWLVAAGAVLAAGAAGAAWLGWRGRALPAVLALAAGGLGCAQLVLTGHDSLAPASSAYHLAGRIRAHVTPGIPFYSLGMYEQTLPFYIKRPITLVEARDELSFGIAREPGKFVADYAEFSRRWQAHDEALAIMHPNTLAYFDQMRLPYEIIGRDTRRAVVRKPRAPASPGTRPQSP